MGSQALFAARHLDHHETYTWKYFHHLLTRELLFKWLDCYADQIGLRCHGIHYHAFLQDLLCSVFYAKTASLYHTLRQLMTEPLIV